MASVGDPTCPVCGSQLHDYCVRGARPSTMEFGVKVLRELPGGREAVLAQEAYLERCRGDNLQAEVMALRKRVKALERKKR